MSALTLKSNRLQQTQALFTKALLEPKNKTYLLKMQLKGKPSDVRAGMEIYQNGYRLRLLQSLKVDFEKSAKAIGKKHFDQICLDAIYNQPSRFHDLMDYSHHLPVYLKKHPRLTQGKPWIASLLEFEILMNLLALGRKTTLKTHLEPSLNSLIMLRASCVLTKSAFDLSLALKGTRVKTIPRQKTYFRISKKGNHILWKKISLAEFKILNILKTQKTIAAMAKSISPKHLHQLSKWFSEWLLEGVIEVKATSASIGK